MAIFLNWVEPTMAPKTNLFHYARDGAVDSNAGTKIAGVYPPPRILALSISANTPVSGFSVTVDGNNCPVYYDADVTDDGFGLLYVELPAFATTGAKDVTVNSSQGSDTLVNGLYVVDDMTVSSVSPDQVFSDVASGTITVSGSNLNFTGDLGTAQAKQFTVQAFKDLPDPDPVGLYYLATTTSDYDGRPMSVSSPTSNPNFTSSSGTIAYGPNNGAFKYFGDGGVSTALLVVQPGVVTLVIRKFVRRDVGQTLVEYDRVKLVDGLEYISRPLVGVPTPTSGTLAGGTSVSIPGDNFTDTTGVTFGGTAATSVVVTNDQLLTCVTPAHAIGAVNIVVTSSSHGTGTRTNGYTYINPPTIIGDENDPGTRQVYATAPPVELTFKLTDPGEDLVNINVEFNPLESGGTWYPAMLQSGTSVSGLASNTAGITHSLWWQPQEQTQLPTLPATVRVRASITSPGDSVGQNVIWTIPLIGRQNLGPRPRNEFLENLDPKIQIKTVLPKAGLRKRVTIPQIVLQGFDFLVEDSVGESKIRGLAVRSDRALQIFSPPRLKIIETAPGVSELINVTGVDVSLPGTYDVLLLDKDRYVVAKKLAALTVGA